MFNRPTLSTRDQKMLVVGYAYGVTVMAVQYNALYKKRFRTFKRSVALTERLLEEAWPHLPSDVKDTYVNEIKFYNIAYNEDI